MHFETKPPPDFSSGGSFNCQPGLLGAAGQLDRAAATAAAAIIRARSRARCADQRQGRYNRKQEFHRILRLSFFQSRPAIAGRADAIHERVRRAAVEPEVVGSGSAPQKCKPQKFRHRRADKPTAWRRWEERRSPWRTGRNIQYRKPVSARAGRIRDSWIALSFSRSNRPCRVREPAAGGGARRERANSKGAARAGIAMFLASPGIIPCALE